MVADVAIPITMMFRKNVYLWLTDKCATVMPKQANTIQGKNGYKPVNTE